MVYDGPKRYSRVGIFHILADMECEGVPQISEVWSAIITTGSAIDADMVPRTKFKTRFVVARSDFK